ncbi:isoform II [Legionella santicrucis]|uniref:Isoform II n=1 Tax=Legionella santicrucis TaxID=45074 RepID=A0A0W0YIJ1_9GAMM|nr:hypothetical protein [Legionella santicrucis]KTD56762.1 isoform II [Legionella santicrucis]
MTLKCIIFIFCVLVTSVGYPENKIETNFLKQPNGPYGVGFEDFHWINQNVCPDINFNGKNQEDFSPNNIKHCHEIITRIYYPTLSKKQSLSPYYPPFVNATLQEIQAQVPNIPKNELEAFKHVKSFSVEKDEVVKNQQFPVLFFIPGSGWPSEIYENSITELVSHGYIVIAISSPFINLVELPNGRVIDPAKLPPKNPQEIAALVPLQKSDVSYIYDVIQNQHNLNIIFSAMDLNHIGIFGHSLGGRVLADVSHDHPTWFQAGATLDIGWDETHHSRNKFTFPFMHEICANRKLISPELPVTFELGDNNYLVVIAPNEQNHTYSYHANFADYSTLQYMPAFDTFLTYAKEQSIKEGFDVKIMLHELTEKETERLIKTTYVLIKMNGEWRGSIYVNQAKQTDFDVNIIEGLRMALDSLSNKSTDKLSDVEVEPIVKEITLLHKMLAAPLGEGNGWVITDAINTYLVEFFDTYLKNKENAPLSKCIPLYKDTYIKCGPGQG